MQPATFAESEGGVVIGVTGWTPVTRWDGYADEPSPAGVKALTTAPGIEFWGDAAVFGELPDGETASGDVTGTAGSYYAAVRFVDRWGNLSDPSPFSAVASRATTSRYISGDTPLTGGTTVYEAPPFVRYTGLPVPAADQTHVVRRQILRNTDGQAAVFYVAIDTTDLTSASLTERRPDSAGLSFPRTSATDTTSPYVDDPLDEQPAQVLLATDRSSLIARYGVPPDTLTAVASHLGRMWFAGAAEHTAGHAAVTQGSPVVAGYATDWRATWVGRYFTAAGGGRTYLITAVTPGSDGQPDSLTLEADYEGATNARAAYAVRPDPLAARVIQFGEAGLPEAVPALNAFSVPAGGGPITAVVPFDSFLFVAQRANLSRLTADANPRSDGAVYDAARRGCAAARTWVEADGRLFLMDERGIYAFDGRAVTPVSTAIQDLFLGTNRDGLRINWGSRRFFHAVNSEAESTVRFFVTINGGGLPRWAVCYNYQAEKLWLENYPWRVGASAATPAGVVLAGQGGRVWAATGVHDGAPAWQRSHAGQVTAASALAVTLPADPGDVVGLPVVVARGRAAGQTRIVVAQSGARLTVDRPFFPVPAAGDTAAVGAVPWRLLTHRLELAEAEDREEFRVVVGYEPQGWGHLAVRRYSDHAAAPDALASRLTPEDGDGVTGERGDPGVEVAVTNRGGYAVLHGDRHLEPNTAGLRSVRLEIEGASGPTRHALNSLSVRGTS